MRYLLNHEQMQNCDKNTMEYYGVISPVLMERAALCVTEEIERALNDRKGSVLIACGTGNNGGDGLAAARMLFLKGYPVTVLYPGNPQKASQEGARQLGIVRKYKIPVVTEVPEEKYDVIVDSIFGIGLSRDVGGNYAEVIRRLNEKTGIKVAVDICSGINTDDGQVMGIAFQADLTVTFGFEKLGHVLYPGAGYSGKVLVRDMGIDRYSLRDMKVDTFCFGREDLALIPERKAYTNKGSYGKIAVFAGSHNMAGAAALSGRAAYVTGAGLVKIITPECNRQIIQTLLPEAVLVTYDEDSSWEDLAAEEMNWSDVAVLGPGLGQSVPSEKLVKAVLNARGEKPLVVDADALNIVAKTGAQKLLDGCIVTPHLGEMSRLCKKSIVDIQKNLITVARNFSKEYNVITVLKDARTVTADPKGRCAVNLSGNNGMATGGSGDVLTGILAGVLAAGIKDRWQAAALADYIHGLSGDRAAASCGMHGMLSEDLITGLIEILREGLEK